MLRSKKLLPVVIAVMFLSGCLASEGDKNLIAEIGAETCISASAVAYDGIEIKVKFPERAVKFMIKRDGVPILETQDKTITGTIDTGLSKGQTYRYRCSIYMDINTGFIDVGQELVVKLDSNTAPIFSGITGAVAEGTDSVRVSWNLSSDEVIQSYRIYKYIGIATDSSDFVSAPVAVITDLSLREYVIDGLGDQIDYSFRVEACNTSNVCDQNNAIRTQVLADTGVPTTTGVLSSQIINGGVELLVPWDDSKGQVSKRTVYRHETVTGGNCPLNIGLYTASDVNVAEPRLTPITFEAPGSINQGVRYCYIVRDSDSLGQQESNTSISFVDTGDLTPPVFTSILNLERSVAFPETRLELSWTAIENEIEDSLLGTSEYIVYLSSALPSAVPDSDPCTTGTQYGAVIPAALFSSGSTVAVTITGLNSRYNYRACVRTRDSSGNYAIAEPKVLQSAGDVSPPVFNGIDSIVYNPQAGTIDVGFAIPLDNDVRNYLVQVERNRGGTIVQLPPVSKTIGAQTPGAAYVMPLTLPELSAQSADILTVVVNACDDAAPAYNTTDNCSNVAVSRVVAIPDTEPPQDFNQINYTVSQGDLDGSVSVSWTNPPSFNDYAGFKLYAVENGNLVGLNSSDCSCVNLNCALNPKNICEVSVYDNASLLDPSKQYEFYLSAYDLEGNSTQQYIAYTGPQKKTSFSRARDKVKPVFNANLGFVIQGAEVKLNFDDATDNQYSGAPDNLDLTYQVYRKEDTAFNFPCVAGDIKDPECDVESVLLLTQASSLFSRENGKLVFVDDTVVDGKTYDYQVCAYDFAYTDVTNPYINDKQINRNCQSGLTAVVAITDITPPEFLTNTSSTKVIGNTSWTISFTIGDNNPISGLNVRIYKSASSYPDQSSPGVPFKVSPGAVTINPVTGGVTFTDTGSGAGPEYYYLAELSDLAGNRVFMTFRDMAPSPVITSVSFSGGEVAPSLVDSTQPQVQTIVIDGQNLSSVNLIDSTDGGVVCSNPGSWTVSDNQITCVTDRPANYGEHNLRVTSSDGQSYTLSSAYTLRTHCEINTDRNVIVNQSIYYGVCFPEHFNLIKAQNFSTAFYVLTQDIDFDDALQGFTFDGIGVRTGNNFRMIGNNYSIIDMVITDNTADANSGLISSIDNGGLNASSMRINPIFENVRFVRPVLNSQATTNIGLLVGRTDVNKDAFNPLEGSSIIDGVINAVGDHVGGAIGANIERINLSGIVIDGLDININKAGAVRIGGLLGYHSDLSTDSDTSFLNNTLNDITITPLDTTHEIGGLVGNIRGHDVQVRGNGLSNIIVGSSSAGGDQYGGLFGSVREGLYNSLRNTTIENNDVEAVIYNGGASAGESFGGIVGYAKPRINLLIKENKIDFTFQGSSNQNYIGGVIGWLVPRGSGLSSISVDISRNALQLNITGGSNAIGGMIGSHRISHQEKEQLILIEDNYIEALTNFDGLSNVSGLLGECTFGTIYLGNTYDINQNYLKIVEPFSAPSGYDPFLDINGKCKNKIVTDGNNVTGLGFEFNFLNNYYDSDLASNAVSDYENIGEVETKTSVELQNQATFVNWDFTSIWRERSGASQAPNLRWE